MIMLGGHNPMGNVIHLIVGPETEMFMDIHGSMIIPVAELLNTFDKNETVFVSFTRCKSEMATQMMLKNAGIMHMASFSLVGQNIVEPGAQTESKAKQESPKAESKKSVERCKYCKRETELLPIPGFKICTVCAQIELGTAKAAKEKHAASNAH